MKGIINQTVARTEPGEFAVSLRLTDDNRKVLARFDGTYFGSLADATYGSLNEILEAVEQNGITEVQIKSDVPFAAKELKEAQAGKPVGAKAYQTAGLFKVIGVKIA